MWVITFSFHAAGQRWGYAGADRLRCVLMRQLCRDEKNTHRATQETSAGLPKVIPLKWKADWMLVIVASRGWGWIVTGVVFQHTSPCSYYGPEMSVGWGTLFRHSPQKLFLSQLSLTRMTCATQAVSRSFGMDVLSYQGLFIFQIKSLTCFQPRTPTGLKYFTSGRH